MSRRADHRPGRMAPGTARIKPANRRRVRHALIEAEGVVHVMDMAVRDAEMLLDFLWRQRKHVNNALAKAGRESVRLVLGIIPILIVAGTIEGFFSPTHLPSALKYVFAAAVFTIFSIYLGMTGRRAPSSSISGS